MQQNVHKRPTRDFRRHFLDTNNELQSDLYGAPIEQQQGVSERTYAIPEQTYVPQRPENYNYQQRVDLAGGDANIQALKAKYSSDGKEIRGKVRQQPRQERTRNDEINNYSASIQSSSHSDSTRKTAIEQSKKGRQLMKLTHSKANLLKEVNEGMSRTQQDHCNHNKRTSACQGRGSSKEMFHYGSEDSNTCSSPSAGVINEKIIHPMIRKFRLLYLHNIKEEVTIMEDLELLPHKLDEICRKMEKE